ncbi:MAG: hypothetical protein ACRDI2_02470 [Chloroflexota bacterium]
MKVFAIYTKRGEGESWRLTAVSALSAERARALAEQEQRRPGSAIKGADLAVREYESIQSVPWSLAAAG